MARKMREYMDFDRFLWDPLFLKQVDQYFDALNREKKGSEKKVERKDPSEFITDGTVVVFLDENGEHPYLFLNDYFVSFDEKDENTYSEDQIVKVYAYDPRHLGEAFRAQDPDLDSYGKLIWKDDRVYKVLEEISKINQELARKKKMLAELLSK